MWKPISTVPQEKDVIVTYELNGKRFIGVGEFIGDDFCSYEDEYFIGRCNRKMIAWTELPAPYKGRADELKR